MREEFLNIQVYDDEELSGLAGCRVLSREKLHHWPLSYVEKVELADGRRLVYKAQRAAASVENEFYSRVTADFLLKPVFSEQGEGWAALGLPYVEHKKYRPGSGDELREHTARWSKMLQELTDVPVYFDISTHDKFIELLENALGAFTEEDELLTSLHRWAEDSAKLCYRDQPVGLLHGDLTGDNIIAEGGELRYILDWQRPMRGPLALDTALALESAGFPLPEDDQFGRMARIFWGIWYSYARRCLLPFPDMLDTARKNFERGLKNT